MGKDKKGKELGKGITQRADGRYVGRYVNRFGKRESVYGATAREAKNNLAKAIADDIKKKNVVEPNITLTEWYNKWMEVYKKPVVRDNTIRHYRYVYEHNIQPYLGNRKLIDINKLSVTGVLNKLKDKGYQWESLNKVKVLLTDMYTRAIEDEYAARNPAQGARNPLPKPENEMKALSVEEQEAFFLCSAGTFYDNLFRVAVSTGLRPGELCALTESDIDFKKKAIHVTKTLLYQQLEGDDGKAFHIEPPKTPTSRRDVPLNQYAIEALSRQVIQHKIVVNNSPKKHILEYSDLLFTTKYGTPINSQIYIDAIDRIVNEINLTRDPLEQMERFSGHCFRHTFATRCFEAGIQPKTVQSYLGHATLQMTMDLYTAVFDKKKQNDIRLLEKTLEFDKIDNATSGDKIIRIS